MNAHLFVRTGPNGGEIHTLDQAVYILGRGEDCDIKLKDPFVSRQHFRIERRETGYWMFDTGSANCTAVNGLPNREKELKQGDEIHVGSTRILFLRGDAASSSGVITNVNNATRVYTKPLSEWGAKFEMIGSSPQMGRVFDLVERVAPLDTTVLIYGESGTGKELVAQALHHRSPKLHGTLVTVNCAAIPRDLYESELFGHEKGAFTGAHAQRLGKFELANGGTLFLDEIGELPLEGQAKLLRVLEERKLVRVGGTREIKLDVRVVAATHQDLSDMVRNGRFRQDLLYRLEVVSLQMPALRERGNDIELLSRHFLELFRQKIGRRIESFSPAAVEKLKSYEWPGNVRELRNVVERAVIMGLEPAIQPDDILLPHHCTPARIERAPIGDGPLLPLEDLLRQTAGPHIERALQLANGNKSKAAELLGIPRSSLYDVAKKFGARLP